MMENKLICVFMDHKLHGDYGYLLKNGNFKLLESLKYHKEWSSLMKVVEKIESLDYKVEICMGACWIYKYSENRDNDNYENLITINDCDLKIDAVYKSCVNFIEIYNLKKL